MTLRNAIFALVASLGLTTGCAGELMPVDMTDNGNPDQGTGMTDTSTPAGAAKAVFESKVAPKLEARCALSGCHAGAGMTPLKFLGSGPRSEYYAATTGYATSVLGNYDDAAAELLVKVNNENHYGPWGADEAGIKEWFAAERTALAAPGGNTGGTGTTPTDPGTGAQSPTKISQQLVSEWSGCMTQADWDAAGVAAAWAVKRADNNGNTPCQSCHVNGGYNFVASQDSAFVFALVTTDPYFMESYFVPQLRDPANPTAAYTPKMVINTQRFAMTGGNQPPHQLHPAFNPAGDAMTRLENFYNLTVQRKANNQCGAPKITF